MITKRTIKEYTEKIFKMGEIADFLREVIKIKKIKNMEGV